MSTNEPTTATTTPVAATTTATAATTTTATTQTVKTGAIKAMTAFSTMEDPPVAIVGGSVAKGMTGNTNFLIPPVDPAVLGNTVASFTEAIQASADGGANAIAVCAKYRALVIQNLKILAIYVENNCNNDMSVFTTSGFTARTPAVKTKGQPAAMPTIRTLAHGMNSGQLTATLLKAGSAFAYNLRYAVMTNGAPGAWTTVPVAKAGKRATISGLTPGTLYAFQVQALGSTGYTDWSDSKTIWCI